MITVWIPSLPTRYDAATHTRVPSLDLNAAARYGAMVNMLEEPAANTQDSINLLNEATEKVQKDDLILCVGDVVLCAAAICMVNEKNGHVNLLRWDRVRRTYEIETVIL